MALCIGCRIKRVNSLANFKSHFNEECYEYRPVSEPCHHVTYTVYLCYRKFVAVELCALAV